MKTVILKIKILMLKLIVNLYFFYVRFLAKRIKILNCENTIDLILRQKLSISRFGDGELSLLNGTLEHIGFQENNKTISKELNEVLNTRHSGLLVCFYSFYEEKNLKNIHGKWLKEYIYKNFKCIRKLLGYSYVYGDARITRFYHPNVNYSHKYIDYLKHKYIPLLKKIWEKKHIIIVEGKNVMLGVGNDLFDNCLDIKRILCPNTNAFDKKQAIYNSVKKHAKKDDLILLALGPTATILSKELTINENLQCIDIGHIDIIYLWFIHQVKEKTKIRGKNNNEVSKDNNKYIEIKYDETEFNKSIIDIID